MLRRAMHAMMVAQKINHLPVLGRELNAEIRRQLSGDSFRPLIEPEQIARRVLLQRTLANDEFQDVRHVSPPSCTAVPLGSMSHFSLLRVHLHRHDHQGHALDMQLALDGQRRMVVQ